VESYGISTALTGCLLAVAACAYVAGNLAARRLVAVDPRGLLAAFALLLAASVAAFGAVRPGPVASTLLFSLAAGLAGARTLLSSAFALARAPEVRPTVASLRATTMQLGYFVGVSAAGAALASAGYAGFGAAMGLFFLTAAVVLAQPRRAAGGRAVLSGAGG